MTSNRWMHLLGTTAAAVFIALSAGPGVAVAEGESDSTSTSSNSESSTDSTAADAKDEDGQPDSVSEPADPSPPTSDGEPSPADEDTDAEDTELAEDTDAEDTADKDTELVDRTADPVDDVEKADTTSSKSAKTTAPDLQPDTATQEVSIETADVAADYLPESATAEQAPASIAQAAITESQPEPVAAEAGATFAAAAVPAMTAPPRPNLINIVGTLLFTIVTLPLRLLEQAPVIPPGYSVAVGRSTLDTGCGCSQSVDARWYFPDSDEPPESVIYLQHGFLRSNSAMSAMAIELAERTNSVVVAPTLSSNFFAADGCTINGEPMQRAVADLFVGDRTALTRSAVAAGWTGQDLPTKFVLAGHSAGGGLAAAAAGYTTDNGSASDLLLVVMLDGVPNGDALMSALTKLQGTNARQVLQIAAPPYAWNANGTGVNQLIAARQGEFVGLQIVRGSHIDAEGASSDFLAGIATGFSRPENVAAVQGIAVGWINDAIAGTAITAPGGAGDTVTIPTAAGTARAVVLGSVAPAALDAGPAAVGA